MAEIDPLDIVEMRTRARDEADREWRKAIYAAHVAGCSNREISLAAGITHEGVRGIIRKEGVK